jgi:hypothetical protein
MTLFRVALTVKQTEKMGRDLLKLLNSFLVVTEETTMRRLTIFLLKESLLEELITQK